jgi:hypothetical protein
MARATTADRNHFRRVAEGSARLEQERRMRAAVQAPGDKLLESLTLSTTLLRGRDPLAGTRPATFSLIRRWSTRSRDSAR